MRLDELRRLAFGSLRATGENRRRALSYTVNDAIGVAIDAALLGNILAGVLQSRLLPKRWIFLSQTTRN